MTPLSPEVMRDLLTLVLAGEASAETGQLVKGHAKEDAAFAELLRSSLDQSLNPPLAPAAAPSKDVHMNTINMTRHYIFMRSLYLGLGIAFSLMPFACAFNNDGLTFLMLREQPVAAAIFGAIGAGCWFGCIRMSRRVGQAGL